jgi:hypothetical protein
VWDATIPATEREFNEFLLLLKSRLLDEVVETGYGVRWQAQDIEYFKKLAQQVRFKVVNEWSKEETFHLEMTARALAHTGYVFIIFVICNLWFV